MKYKATLLCLLLSFMTALSAQTNDRQAWVDLACKIAEPVLRNMAEGKLVQEMPLELSPDWAKGRHQRAAYMEAFGRLMMGIAPWLALPDDDTPEGARRKQLRQWALKAYANAVNPESPDYLLWRSDAQPLVDAAFLASSFLRAPEALWQPLDAVTKQRYIEEFTQMRRVTPGYSNWLLFASTIETFLLSVDAPHDFYRIRMGLAKTEEWYVGDGWYSDGPQFAFDYYNSFVIQPMYLEILEVLAAKKIRFTNRGFTNASANLDAVRARMRRYAEILERLISPEGAFPVFGRSITYRLAVFQPLSLLSWKEELPASLPEGQVRAAITAVMKRMFEHPGNFTSDGFLRLGFAGHQPGMTDAYINSGSLYLTAAVFLPLGLPPAHSFWTSPAEPWTAQKAWSGQPFPKDKKISGNNLPAAKSASRSEVAAAPHAPAAVLDIMHRVADWQLANMPPTASEYTGDPAAMPRIAKSHPTPLDWTFAAYYAGHLALAGISPRSAEYLETFAKLGRKHQWQLAPRKNTRYHADDHAIGQSYIEYAFRVQNPAPVGPTREFFDFLLSNPPRNPDNITFDISTPSRQFLEKWSWCDALFMAPPTLARLYEHTGDIRYIDYMNNRWWHTTAYLYDKDEHLYYRDSRFFDKREANGKKIFWGRGNGWVLGGLVRVLQSMPDNYPDRPRYEQLFRDMCARFLALQHPDGLWRASLLDPASFPVPETSSTGFATYAFAWGVNAGLLDRATYWPATIRAWRGLTSHVTPGGKLNYCQPIGGDPQKIQETDTDVYGPGALLLAGAEIYKALLLEQNPNGVLTVQNATNKHRLWSVVEVPAAKLLELTGSDNPADILVFGALTPLLHDTHVRPSPAGPALAFRATIPPNDTRRFILVRKPAGNKPAP